MKKKNTNSQFLRLVKAFVIVLGSLALLLGVFILSLMWVGYNEQFYDPDEIAETCIMLNIEYSDFCTLDKRMNSEDLEQALETVYPPEVTNYNDIIGAIDGTVYLALGTCESIVPNRTNQCPEPNTCSSAYSCYIDSSAQRIRFGFNEDGQLGGFTVPPDS